ncbi:MAG: hypothetical protein B6229_01840 [Spirochaetaceae bacterium 4572_7]|nr:MAG: hypothetical protein B6229_01840 [Spirochaetaceae bacterium 4572_7]
MKKPIIELKLPVGYNNEDLLAHLKKIGHKNIKSVEVLKKSLDARKKDKIVWNIQLDINNPKIDFKDISENALEIPYKTRNSHVIIVGSGPSGIFSGLVLLKAGFKVTIIERGSKVENRDKDIANLMEKGIFNSESNFAFGEGGAGTYSDGKLTSRNKHISKEKKFILSTFINNGAPKEIYSLVHPHVGSDNLKIVAKNMRNQFTDAGGVILFDTSFISFKQKGTTVNKIISSKGEHDCDYLILATGHSAFDTYRELIKRGLIFNTKNFALGFRAEHPQLLINNAQWGRDSLPGVKAAEYRITAKTESSSVYSFCMCPGGQIVPAGALQNTSVVNGMSNFKRNSEFANAAVVASFNFSTDLQRVVPPEEALERLQRLEESYFLATGGYSVPGMKISDFIASSLKESVNKTSYPLGVTNMDLSELLPKSVIAPLKEGLSQFNNKLKGYETGNILGLESKTSSPIQVSRNKEGLCNGFSNLYFVGEGSGWAGGIISSGADGIRGAINIIEKE